MSPAAKDLLREFSQQRKAKINGALPDRSCHPHADRQRSCDSGAPPSWRARIYDWAWAPLIVFLLFVLYHFTRH